MKRVFNIPDNCFDCPMWKQISVQGENSPSSTDKCTHYKKTLNNWDIYAHIKPKFCKVKTGTVEVMDKVMMAAVLQDGVVYTGKRHSDVFRSLMACGIGIKEDSDKVQGFILNNGKFVNRAEAEKIARSSGQLKGKLIGSILTSEDLY